MLGGGCWCFTMLWIALTLPYLLLAVSVTRNWINALSLSHTHSNPRKHSDALVRAESMCNSHTALQSRTPAKLSSPCLSGLFFSSRLLRVKPLRGDTGFIFREKACEQPCLLALWVFSPLWQPLQQESCVVSGDCCSCVFHPHLQVLDVVHLLPRNRILSGLFLLTAWINHNFTMLVSGDSMKASLFPTHYVKNRAVSQFSLSLVL